MIECPHCRTPMHEPAELAGQVAACPACGGRFLMPASRFDPYHTWLGIPPSEQPPHLYRLLGLRLSEADPRVIENAADRQIMHLKSLCSGPNGPHAQRLLNEVETARVSLLDPGPRAVYDEQLRRAIVATSVATYPPQAGASSLAVVSSGGQATPVCSTPARLSSSRSSRRKPSAAALGAFSSLFVVFGGITGLAIGVLIVYYLTGQDFLGLSNRLRNNGVAARPNGPSQMAKLPRDGGIIQPQVPRPEQRSAPALERTPETGRLPDGKTPPKPSEP